MKGLIVVTVLLVVLLAGAVVCSRMLGDYRSGLLAAEQREVRARNQEKVDAYNAEVQEYKQSLSSNKANKSWPQPTGEGMEIIDLTTFPLEMPGQVTVNRTDVMMGGLLLVNEWHSRPEDFDESGILSVSGYARNVGLDSFWSNSSIKLHANAIDALVQALTAAKAEGYQNFVIEDAYRTWERQNELFQKQVDAYRASNPSYSEEKLIERAKKRINYPGTSEFNSGLSFSLYIWAKDNAELNNADFYDTPNGKWFYENSWRHGLVFRFPKDNYPYPDTADKTYKTGMGQKLNCYRYVGKAHAAVMHHLDLCLEEYIEYLQEHPHIAVFEDGVKKYEITRQQVGDDLASFSVQINQVTDNYTMSLDNMGGVVVAYEF